MLYAVTNNYSRYCKGTIKVLAITEVYIII